MRAGQFFKAAVVAMAAALAFSGCGTLGALNNLVNGVVGTAVGAADKTLNTASNTAGKALTPNTYKNLPAKARRQPRSYSASSTAPRTSARNFDAQNSRSNSVRSSKSKGAKAFFQNRARR